VLPDLLSGQPTTLGQLPDSPTIQLAPSATVPPIVVGGMSELAAACGRPTAALMASMLTAISDDGALPPHDALVRRLTDVNGMYGSPTDQVTTLLTTGGPTEIAARLAEYSDIGAERIVVTLAAGDWYRQAELVAEARASLDRMDEIPDRVLPDLAGRIRNTRSPDPAPGRGWEQGTD
jgi:hypothetical protein